MRVPRIGLAVLVSVIFVLAACQGGTGGSAQRTAVRLQLQWFPQAQFAGYYAAAAKGYYTDEGLDLTIIPGSADIAPQVVGSASDGPEFTIAWVPKVLQARESEAGSDLVNIAQVFQRAGTLSVSWKDSGITSPADFKGKKVGAWGFGNELEVIASAKKAGLTPGTDFTQVTQGFSMDELIAAHDGCAATATNCVDVAEAMIYNEYAQLLEAKDPATGQLYQPTDLNVIDYNKVGTAMLQDALWARAAWLAQGTNKDTAVKFLRATFKGWIYCRDHSADCVQFVTDAGSTLGAGHQKWMMNEINALIWPSPDGIGVLSPAAWSQTVDTALAAEIIKAAPPDTAFRTDLTTEALNGLSDATGDGFKKAVVEITAGGA
ncbi:MAG: ABC transporter substrate-binding protein [Chloroflexota bacterium]|nr:ABC transporter substrate-binding protein [Chloroflexota bacterium]